MLKTTTPFQGFYESVHDMYIEDAIKSNFDDREGSGMDKTPWELDLNYSKAMQEYSRLYVQAFARELNVKLEYESTESPREYNFTTDRIFCEIPESEVLRLWDNTDKDAFDRHIKDKFSDRSGFISFYQSSLNDNDSTRTAWPQNVLEWDCNQIGTLIEFIASETLSEDWEMYAVESFYFDDIPEPARAYGNWLYEQQEEGKDFDDLPEYSEWKELNHA